jgi:hypothetical protein
VAGLRAELPENRDSISVEAGHFLIVTEFKLTSGRTQTPLPVSTRELLSHG